MRGLCLALAASAVAACSVPRWPVDAPMTSPYGVRLMGWRPNIHRGVDLDAATLDMGIDLQAMLGLMGDFQIAEAIRKDAEMAKGLGVRRIPMIFVNNKLLPRWQVNGVSILGRVFEEAGDE